MIDINLYGGKEVCEEIRKNGGKEEFFVIDVSNPEAMEGAFEAVADTYWRDRCAIQQCGRNNAPG